MRRLSLAFGLLLVLFVPFKSRAVLDDWLPVTEEDRKITAETEKGADAVMLYHEETSDDNTRHRYVYQRVKILTEKGKARANVEIPFDATIAGIADIKARTIAPDGTVTPFTGKAFNTTVAKGHGIKYEAKTFTLPNVQVGSILEWKYTEYWETYVFAPHWTVQEDIPQKRAKFAFLALFKSGHYVVDSRGDIKDRVYYSFIGLPESTALKTIGDNRMELELKDIPAFEQEEFAPPPATQKMRVNFYYGTNKMGQPQEFWKQEGKYWSKEVDKFIGSPSSLSSFLTQVVAPSDSPEQKLRKIYSYVQKIRNLSYLSREGRMEALISEDAEKRSAESALRKREGQRDEIARVFVGLARAAGIQAYAMRVADRDREFFQPRLPNPLQLTSELAIAVVDGKEVFLDPGTPMCPFGLLRWQHTSTQGLRQTSSGTEIAATPAADYKNAISKRVGRLTLAADGSAHGQVAIAWTGEDALSHRLSGLTTDEAGRKKELEGEVKTMLPPGAVVELLKENDADNADAQLSATFKVDVPSFASNAGKRMLVPTQLFQGSKMRLNIGPQRRQPVYFNYPFYTMDDVQISFPPQFKMESLPQTAPLRTNFSLYKVQRTVNGNTISFARDFAVAGIAFLKDDYPELGKFFDGVTTGDSEQVVLTSAQ